MEWDWGNCFQNIFFKRNKKSRPVYEFFFRYRWILLDQSKKEVNPSRSGLVLKGNAIMEANWGLLTTYFQFCRKDTDMVILRLQNLSPEQTLCKCVGVRSYSGSHFPAFRLNTERRSISPYSVRIRTLFSQWKEQTGTDIVNKKKKYNWSCYRDFTTKMKRKREKKTGTKLHLD